MTYQKTVAIKPSEIYKDIRLLEKVLANHKILDFRPVTYDDSFISDYYTIMKGYGDTQINGPRFIIEVQHNKTLTDVWE